MSERIDVYTDGSGTYNRFAPACIGVHVLLDDVPVVECSEYVGSGSNQFAELRAIRRGLFLAEEIAKTEFKKACEVDPDVVDIGWRDCFNITVHTDSQYAIGVLWNRDFIVRSHEKLIEATRFQIDMLIARVEWVRGHTGVVGNEIADYLAHLARCRKLDRPPEKKHPSERRKRAPRAEKGESP